MTSVPRTLTWQERLTKQARERSARKQYLRDHGRRLELAQRVAHEHKSSRRSPNV